MLRPVTYLFQIEMIFDFSNTAIPSTSVYEAVKQLLSLSQHDKKDTSFVDSVQKNLQSLLKGIQ